MLNYENATAIVPENKKESAKCIIQDLDGTMKEIQDILWLIRDSIIGPLPAETSKGSAPVEECMIDTLQSLRNEAQRILKTALAIREGLW